MIPPFDDSGCLPPGIHPATLDEIEARFGRSSEQGLPFLDMAIVRAKVFERYLTRIFASDRYGAPKGMMEVVI